MNFYHADRRHFLLVYGTMKRGQRNHARLGEAVFVSAATTTKPWFDLKTKRTSKGRAPVLLPGASRISGELFLVDGPTMAVIDLAEGHPFTYQRVPILVDQHDKPVWTYRFVDEDEPLSREGIVNENAVLAFS